MPSSRKLDCVPLSKQSADRLPPPQRQSLFSALVSSFSFSASLSFVFFFAFFFPPYYEFVELGTTTLGWKLGIIFAQRLLLPSDEPKKCWRRCYKTEMQRSVHRTTHRKWEDMPPNGISDAKTPRKSQNSKRGRMGKCIIEGSSTNGAPLGAAV